MEKFHKDNVLHNEDNFGNIFNNPNEVYDFQDAHGVHHWRDINGLHDGNVSPFDAPSSNNNIHDIFHNSNHQELGNNENSLFNSHEHCFENNMVNLDDGSFDLNRIDNPNDNVIENNSFQANDEISHHLFDNNDHVSFGSYYYTGPNGEKLYKAGDGHTYDINGNKVD